MKKMIKLGIDYILLIKTTIQAGKMHQIADLLRKRATQGQHSQSPETIEQANMEWKQFNLLKLRSGRTRVIYEMR